MEKRIYYKLIFVGGQFTDLGASSTSVVDLDELITPGAYITNNTGATYVNNKPSGVSRGFRVDVIPSMTGGSYVRQRLQEYNSLTMYERVTVNGGTSWSPNWTIVQGS